MEVSYGLIDLKDQGLKLFNQCPSQFNNLTLYYNLRKLKISLFIYSQCSQTCGKGQRVRQVRCLSDGEEVEESRCTKEKPLTIKGCRKERCPPSERNRNRNRNINGRERNRNHNRNNQAQNAEGTTNTDYSWKKGKWTAVSEFQSLFLSFIAMRNYIQLEKNHTVPVKKVYSFHISISKFQISVAYQ